MLNTIPLKSPEQKLKYVDPNNIENIIEPNPVNNWSQSERSNLLQKNHEKNNDNIIKSFHGQFNNIGQNKIPVQFNESSNKSNEHNLKNDDLIKPKEFLKKEIPQNINNENKTMISFSKKLKKITIYDENNNIVGYFTIWHIIKYLANIYDSDRQFMTNIDLSVYKKAKELIKTFIFKIDYCKKNKRSDIIIHDYINSGIMGDIGLLIELNDLLYEYQENELYNDLSHVSDNNKIKIEQNIKKFIYLLLVYTLKLCVIISDKIKNTPDYNEMKSIISTYAIICSNRINLFVQEQLSVIYVLDKEIKKAYDTNMDIKNILKKKLESITKEIVEEHKSEKVIVNGSDALAL